MGTEVSAVATSPSPPLYAKAGYLVFAGGHLPRLPDGSVPEDFAAQVRLVLEKLATTLDEAGSGLDRLVKVNAYLADIDRLPEFNAIYYEVLDGLPLPPRTAVEVARFRDSSLLEVEAIARAKT
jgi:2-iminobutanoate/2-iminopropanoate deaminase